MKAVFLDKDGTLIEDVPYNIDPDRIRLCAGALEAVQMLAAADYQIFIITNQSGIARGYFPESALINVEKHLRQLLATAGVSLASFYYCPHHPQGVITEFAIDCDCRKPNPGLLKKAAKEHSIKLDRSWMIGDILNDIEAGNIAGCRTILIDNGNENEWQISRSRLPNFIVNNLREAAAVIMASDRSPPQKKHPYS
ncbi:MAG: Histidine biosynthesis bifunctional protein HisB [Chroococcidiopsis cubana SAG 39.79]|uniref:D,D-heptose 1,7-bisphosphate phosphatase n=2 Tax=Chroococcidiopsis TaxID=54298 RepID=K9TYN5_CHRTP|nr:MULTISPECIES: HAD family hydrolase [Chroococcidiopsis]AFY87695.1 hydrolase, HAD-superfamily, subfamily IIIA [Chroococcidiopsis thermalis PCC 7203]MDZ4875210.1 Histidine biosynthesis bifunctional protein HisB [Chroococcidiopsis cubana SAG 39.79]PSB66421.1 HAD family hydrolase [Chroococcidiopsis cubana CCALA 043]RUT11815.1 D,D-heptose 1,7-bisphosphate phosphatase [Chroococcidiopsis cubana SAG 39.79]URD52598.1 HAD family hydrolase [Chroococcidiopsis sp. CCNUC1]